mmetsp:Transcript_50370/g.107900  ORF Transcript_50370/g.107900 Transcript_50370/m.107900 type:complete len:738 (-) Transcript_50370:58-2271(-)
MSVKLLVVAFAAFPAALQAVKMREGASRMAANPVRKVVTMLQAMQTKVSEEGEKEADLYKKFNCYCKTSGGDLADSVSAAEGKVPTLTADITAVGEQKVQTEQELSQAKTERAAAKAAMDEATAIREKEAAAFAAEKAEAGGDVASLEKAIAVIEKGVSGAFLQTPMASKLKKLALATQDMASDDRQTILSFLSGEQGDGYAPQSGEIVGILKQMMETMAKGLAESTKAEEEAISSYEGLMAAKKKEVAILTQQIEKELQRIGELGVQVGEMGNDLEATQDALAADEKFLSELDSGCDTKAKEWDVIKATRAEELQALAETIKVLNDDDALELFKKTLPSTGTSLVQIEVGAATVKARALKAIRTVPRRKAGGVPMPDRWNLDLIELALKGKQQGFEKVITMIDEMVSNLKKEQEDDDAKKVYCDKQLDTSDDKKKELELSISDSESAIAELEGSIKTLKEEIAKLEEGIKALDTSVAEATEQRKSENESYKELMASDSTAKELILWAKNRLNKFYNPALYKPPPERELTEEERITVNLGGTLAPTPPPTGIAGTDIGEASLVQVSVHRHSSQVAPPPPPETFGPYTKKTGKTNGVIAMMDLLVKDLDKEMQVADVEEKESQKEYETMMADSAEKRAEDAKLVAEKTSAKASEGVALEAEKENKASTSKELMTTLEYIKSLHGECDWLLQYHAVRKDARTSEIEALGKAKAVLSGADYSLLQTQRSAKVTGFLASRH